MRSRRLVSLVVLLLGSLSQSPMAAAAPSDTLTVTVSVTADTTGPLVVITTPASDGVGVEQTVNVEATASDPSGINRVELFVDGVFKATDMFAPYQFQWDSAQVPNATHALRVVAYDQAAPANTGEATRSVITRNISQAGPSLIGVVGRQLLVQQRNVDGSLQPEAPYVIRGVDWSPASRNTPGGGLASVRRPEFGTWYQTDIPLLKAMNVNTVRVFMDLGLLGDAGVTVPGLTMLDEFYRNGIMVIMTVDDGNGTASRVSPAVTYYKNHPAILAWSLGSEWNINLFWDGTMTLDTAAQRIEDEAATIKSLDTTHPVISSYGEFDLYPGSIDKLIQFVNRPDSKVDIWSFNLYRGDSFGALWVQWPLISTKPMFLAEFGVDAFHATLLVNPAPPGAMNEAEQAQWDLLLWDDIVRNLSANDPAKLALGGTMFEWNDEWWKVSPPGVQDTGGWFSGGFPDGMGNEEYFGLVNIDRTPRQVYAALQNGFRSDYVPPPAPPNVTFRVISRGGLAQEYPFQYGVARFYKGGTLLYQKTGGGGGGRSFNIAAINPSTGALAQPAQNFDVWIDGPSAVTAMQAFINGLPNGTLLLIAVADEAGLTINHLQPCTPKAGQYVQDTYQLMEGLGSTQIRNYCYWGSWAMVAVKGQGYALAESLKNDSIGDPPGEPVELTVPFNFQLP